MFVTHALFIECLRETASSFKFLASFFYSNTLFISIQPRVGAGILQAVSSAVFVTCV